jgi:hypothetical protein
MIVFPNTNNSQYVDSARDRHDRFTLIGGLSGTLARFKDRFNAGQLVNADDPTRAAILDQATPSRKR